MKVGYLVTQIRYSVNRSRYKFIILFISIEKVTCFSPTGFQYVGFRKSGFHFPRKPILEISAPFQQ